MGLPTFVHLGPGKTGTTALRVNLLGHPEITLSSRHEPSFFATDRQKRDNRNLDTLADYEALFEATLTTRVIGDISPNYLPSFVAARAMHHVLPDARLVVCLRHPVERAYSHFLMIAGARGWRTEDFEEKLVTALQQFERNGVAGPDSWFATTSLYADAIGRYLEYFDREQLAVLLYDALVQHPAEWYAAFFSHIGLDPATAPAGTRRARVGIAAPQSFVLHRFLRGMASLGLSSLLSDHVRSRLKEGYRNLNRKGPTRLSPEETDRLFPLYIVDVRRTSQLVGMDLEPAWRNRSSILKPG